MLNEFFRKPRQAGLADVMLGQIKANYLFVRLDESGKILEANDLAAKSVGMQPHEMVGRDYAQFMRPKDIAAHEFDKILGTVRNGEAAVAAIKPETATRKRPAIAAFAGVSRSKFRNLRRRVDKLERHLLALHDHQQGADAPSR